MRLLLGVALLALSWPLAALERVVSLAPSLNEIMLELDAGELLVGLLDAGPRPPALAGLPSLGSYGQVQVEALLELRPDLVLLAPGSVSPAQQEQMRRLGLRYWLVEPRTLEDLGEVFAELGRQVGRGEQGRRLAARFRHGLAGLRERYRREQPLTVFYQVWPQPLFTVGGEQILSEVLEVCGARNVFDDLRQPAPQVTREAVLARDPAVILGGDETALTAWRAWPTLRAVRREQLWVVPDRGIERPSFQMLRGTEALCEQLAKARD